MTGAGTITFGGTLVGLPTGQTTISVVYQILSAIDVSLEPSLALGDNVIPIPSGANGVVIEMPPSNSTIVTMKGTSGDSGIAIHRSFGTPFFFDEEQVSFILNISVPLNGVLQLKFF